MLNRKKVLIAGGVLLLIGTIGFAAWKAMSPADQPGKPVQTVLVKEMDLEARVFVNGRIQSKTIREITADESGKVLTVPVRPGDAVAAGGILCTLDPGDLAYRIEQKTIQLEQEKFQAALAGKTRGSTLKSGLELALEAENKAKAELARYQALYDTGALSASEYQEYVHKYRQAQDAAVTARAAYESREDETNAAFRIRLLESELSQLQQELDKKTLRSPIAGVVTEVNVKPLDAAVVEGPLFVVEDTAHLEAVAQISEFDIGKVKPGLEAVLEPSGLKGVELKGVVASVAPVAKLQTTGQTRETVIEVKIDVLEPVPELKSNFSTEIIIKAQTRKNALTVPYEALYISPEGQKQVFAVEDGVLRVRPAKIGIEGDLDLEVAFEGICKDLPVIMNPTDALKEGDKVKPINPEEGGPKK